MTSNPDQLAPEQENFAIPAQLVFQPYPASWRIERAQIVEWAKPPEEGPVRGNEKSWLRVFIPGYWTPDKESKKYSKTVLMDYSNIPSELISPDEKSEKSSRVDGREFTVLFCQQPEWMTPISQARPYVATKNAWTMRKEFLDLDPSSDWDQNLQRFLNRWGAWDLWMDFSNDPDSPPPGFMLAFPHLIKEQREKFREASLPENGHDWLSNHSLHYSTRSYPPYHFVEVARCKQAIEATITIGHLAKRRFGFCERAGCNKVFEMRTRREKRFCSTSCEGKQRMQRWRAKTAI